MLQTVHSWSKRRRRQFNALPVHKRRDLKPLDSRGWSTTGKMESDYCKKMGYPARQSVRYTGAEDRYLKAAFEYGFSVAEIAQDHQRSEGGIHTRLVRLGAMPRY